jgi:hemerythrin-like metal-binding protein
MDPYAWSEALWLDFAPMDNAHREFAHVLGQAQAAPDSELPLAWAHLLAQAQRHFGQEDAWMRETGFAAAQGHLLQHRVVLNVLLEGRAMARAGQLPPVRTMADELAAWYTRHTQSHDAALALHLRRHVPPGPDAAVG